MLTSEDDMSNDSVTLGPLFFAIVFAFRVRSGQSTGNHRRIGGGIQIAQTWLQALLPFPAPPPEHPGELPHRLIFSVHL